MKDKILLSIISVYIAIVFSLPHIYGIWKLKSGYSPFGVAQGLSYIFDETYTYAPETNQIIRFGFRGDSYIWENRLKPSPFIGEIASIIPLSLLSAVTGSTAFSFIIADVIFPPLLFLLIYKGLRSQQFGKLFSATTSLGVITIPFISLVLPKLSSYGTQFTGTTGDPLFFSRTPHPQISSIFLFVALFLTPLVLKNPNRKFVYFWAVSIGLSIYASPFVSSTIIGSLILLTPTLYRKLNIRAKVITIAIIGLSFGGLVINFLSLQMFINDSDFLLRSTFPQSFLFPAQLRFLVIGLLLLVFGRKNIFLKVLAIFLISGSLLVDVHQIILGRNIEADHWLSRVLAPLGTLALFLLIQKLFDKYKFSLKKVIWSAVIVGLIVTAIYKQQSWIVNHPQLTSQDQEKEKLFSQIERQTDKNDVIGVLPSNLNDEIAARTGRLVYLAPGDRTLTNSQEQLQRACHLITLSLRQDDSQLILATTRYVVGLEKFDKIKTEKALDELKSCLKHQAVVPNAKLDYVVYKNSESGKLTLIRAKELESRGGNN